MSTIRITLPAIRRAVSTILRKYGTEYNYTEHNVFCHYENSPSQANPEGLGCLIGEIFKELSFPVPGGGPIGSVIDQGYQTATGVHHVVATPKAAEYMRAAQWAQDSGKTWGEARVAGEVAAAAVYRF